MKYVITHPRDFPDKTCVIAFQNEVTHRDMIPCGWFAVAAGFFDRDKSGAIYVSGRSESLRNLGPKSPVYDSLMLTLSLDYCMSGLDVENIMALAELKGASAAYEELKRIKGI